MQLGFFTLLGAFTSFWTAGIGAVIYWILFDMAYNKVTLKKPLLYVGKTAQIDLLFWKIFGKLAPVMMLVIKLSLLAFLIYMTIKQKDNFCEKYRNPVFYA